jgi:ElaB/YqjD/DUF883 family membrane-anchored ribosome-binding protein
MSIDNATADRSLTHEQLGRKIRRLELRLDETQRKAQGSELANRRVSQLEKDHTRLSTDLETLQRRIELFGEGASGTQLSAFTEECTRIENLANAHWTDLNEELDTVKRRIDDHDDELVEVNGRLNIIGESAVASAEASASAHARIDRFIEGVPTWTVALAAVIGVLTGALYSAHDFNHKVTFNNVAVTVTSAANSPWAAVLAGTLAAVAVIGLALWITDRYQTRGMSEASASVQANLRGGSVTIMQGRREAPASTVRPEPTAPRTGLTETAVTPIVSSSTASATA